MPVTLKSSGCLRVLFTKKENIMTLKERLFYILLAIFVAWLALLAVLGWYVMSVIGIDQVDAALALAGGLGSGLITEFFLMALTLAWNYWFRKQTQTPDT